jgi:hypothetical protein
MTNGKAIVVFVGGNTFVDKTIEFFSHGKHSHVAVFTNGYTYEAKGEKEENDPYPGVWKREGNKYADDPYAKFVEVELPNKEAADKWADSVLGTLYAYAGCGDGLLHDVLNANLPCDGQLTMNCSEFTTRYLREGGCDILHGVYADAVTPADDERALEGGD